MKADWVDEAQEVTQLMVDSQVERIRSSLISPAVSPAECELCGHEIPEARRRVLPGVRLCVEPDHCRVPAACGIWRKR